MTEIASLPSLQILAEESLHKAAESFGFMAGQKMGLKDVSISEKNITEDHVIVSEEAKYLLTTEIIGDMNGKSYLVFDQDNAEKIFKNCTGAEIGSSSMGVDLILKELDNIVSASMISVMANHFRNQIYGDVPHFFESSQSGVKMTVAGDYEHYLSQRDQILLQCRLQSENDTLTADFIWIISGDIANNLS